MEPDCALAGHLTPFSAQCIIEQRFDYWGTEASMRVPKPRKSRKPQPTSVPKQLPTFLLELPLRVSPAQARRLRAHLEAARQLYNAILSEGQRRLSRMRADPAWQAARAIPRTEKQERARAFGALRRHHGFSEYALHDAAKGLNCTRDS